MLNDVGFTIGCVTGPLREERGVWQRCPEKGPAEAAQGQNVGRHPAVCDLHENHAETDAELPPRCPPISLSSKTPPKIHVSR